VFLSVNPGLGVAGRVALIEAAIRRRHRRTLPRLDGRNWPPR
jgi:hypothetical protein